MKEQEAQQRAAAKQQAERAKALWLTLPDDHDQDGEFSGGYYVGNGPPKPPRFRGKIEAGRDGYKCEICGVLHGGEYGSGRFCGQGCRNRANGEKAGVAHHSSSSSRDTSSLNLLEGVNGDLDNDSAVHGAADGGGGGGMNKSSKAQLYGTGIMGALALLPVGWWQSTSGSLSPDSSRSDTLGDHNSASSSSSSSSSAKNARADDEDDDYEDNGDDDDDEEDFGYGAPSSANSSSSSSSSSAHHPGLGSGGGGKARKWIDVKVTCWVHGRPIHPSWQTNVIHLQVLMEGACILQDCLNFRCVLSSCSTHIFNIVSAPAKLVTVYV